MKRRFVFKAVPGTCPPGLCKLTGLCLMVISFFSGPGAIFAAGEVAVDIGLEATSSPPRMTAHFTVPEGHFLYADKLHFEVLSGGEMGRVSRPDPVTIRDPFTGEGKEVYTGDVAVTATLAEITAPIVKVQVSYQACTREICSLPVKKEFVLQAASHIVKPSRTASRAAPVDWLPAARMFRIEARAVGYMGEEKFVAFLKQALCGAVADHRGERGRRSMWLLLLMVFAGGVALNLTPCVLPLIPVNLAILGATSGGPGGGSRRRGFVAGLMYGAGMALAYGGLGMFALLTGSTFGTLNASAAFNAGISVFFLVMALAMFDVIHVDFSRYQTHLSSRVTRNVGALVAFFMGALAAVLAGACVAPIVISVLLWSGKLVAEGHRVAVFLPLLLGLGMGAPWPLMGAGIARLPAPGRWMVWVRNLLAVGILMLGLYYGRVAVLLWRGEGGAGAGRQGGEWCAEDEIRRVAEVLTRAAAVSRPILLDFGASWCKACIVMDRTTLRSKRVRELLNQVIVLKVAAEDPNHPLIRRLLEYYQVRGFPSFILLKPNENAGAG
ncbi:MAG TPA: DUF255 domain-containing protein [Kiritimatiellae bacterium]|nr:DUF255 domain-containing protein [Kiritimatiellia bacterium]